MIVAEIMGGPDDGKQVALPDGVWELRVAFPLELHKMLQAMADNDIAPDPSYVEVCMPIQRRDNKWYAIWKEPRRPC